MSEKRENYSTDLDLFVFHCAPILVLFEFPRIHFISENVLAYTSVNVFQFALKFLILKIRFSMHIVPVP